jgi:hypothetical protein
MSKRKEELPCCFRLPCICFCCGGYPLLFIGKLALQLMVFLLPAMLGALLLTLGYWPLLVGSFYWAVSVSPKYDWELKLLLWLGAPVPLLVAPVFVPLLVPFYMAGALVLCEVASIERGFASARFWLPNLDNGARAVRKLLKEHLRELVFGGWRERCRAIAHPPADRPYTRYRGGLWLVPFALLLSVVQVLCCVLIAFVCFVLLVLPVTVGVVALFTRGFFSRADCWWLALTPLWLVICVLLLGLVPVAGLLAVVAVGFAALSALLVPYRYRFASIAKRLIRDWLLIVRLAWRNCTVELWWRVAYDERAPDDGKFMKDWIVWADSTEKSTYFREQITPPAAVEAL